MTAPPPADWGAALVAVLFIAVLHRSSVGVLATAEHVRAHRAQHLALALAAPR